MKSIIRLIATFVWHPVMTVYLLLNGTKQFTIMPQMTINNIKKLNVGSNFYLGRNSRFLIVTSYKGSNYTSSVRIGNNVSIGNRFTALSAAPIVIEDDCLLASDILITSENHGMNPVIHASYADNPLDTAPVNIGKGCWIGEKAVILPGVTLGDKCIVAAGAVVNKSFPSYTLIGGVPARALKTYDFDTQQWESVKNRGTGS